jgi:hypothetical protein
MSSEISNDCRFALDAAAEASKIIKAGFLQKYDTRRKNDDIVRITEHMSRSRRVESMLSHQVSTGFSAGTGDEITISFKR